MDKQQKLKIALPLLAIVMAFVWGPIITGVGSKKKDNKGVEEGAVPSISQGSAAGDIMAITGRGQRKRVRTKHIGWGRNPFIPGYDPKSLMIEGIVWDDLSPKAIINGNITSVGDHIGPNTIIKIDHSSVTIRSESGDVVLKLGEGREL